MTEGSLSMLSSPVIEFEAPKVVEPKNTNLFLKAAAPPGCSSHHELLREAAKRALAYGERPCLSSAGSPWWQSPSWLRVVAVLTLQSPRAMIRVRWGCRGGRDRRGVFLDNGPVQWELGPSSSSETIPCQTLRPHMFFF